MRGYTWVYRPKASKPSENEKKQIDAFMKKHVAKLKTHLPKPRKNANYVTDVWFQWKQNRAYLTAKYAVNGPNALAPSFEDKFARLECFGNGKCALYALRHNGEWVRICWDQPLKTCLKELTVNTWFQIF